MENGGIIDIELYDDMAPVTVENFIIPKNLYKTGYDNNRDCFIESIYSEPSIITSPVSVTTY
jgi:cyclophilin family peptidyl-prolyl cis-trans isomerase